jgi:hypothetical protein
VEGLLPSIILFADDTQGRPLHDVSLQVDGKVVTKVLDGRPVFLDPGVHRFVLSSEQHGRWEREVVVRTGEKNRSLRAVLGQKEVMVFGTSRESEGTSVPTISWLLFGVGAVALGTGSYLGLDARADVVGMRSSCAPQCSSSEVDDARGQLLVADVALGAGAIAVATAAWFWAKDEPNTLEQARIGVVPGGWAAAYSMGF